MDQVAWRLSGAAEWTRLDAGTPGGKPRDVVLRAMDRAVEFAVGASPDAPDADPVTVPAGAGRRLAGLHHFARPAVPGGPCRITVRGI